MRTTVLDHGFVELLNISGPIRRPEELFDASDRDPAISARMSFNNYGEERTLERDLKLINYLVANQHNTPIEMIETWWLMKLPIFVARQFVRHRTVTINEVSARYVQLPSEWYIPDIVGGKATNKKQGQADNLSKELQEEFKFSLNEQCAESYARYSRFIAAGVAPEQARLFLHVNHYTLWLWKQNLHNLKHFLKLRLDPHAQIEAQRYARAMREHLQVAIPELVVIFDNDWNLA